MTSPIGNIDNTTLLALSDNLDIGDVADPALRLTYFQYLNVYIQTITTAYNAFVMNGAIGSVNLADLSVITAKINDLAVTTGKMADLAVTTSKLNDLAVTLAKMATSSVGTAQLIDSSVINSKIADGVITAAKFVAGALSNETQNGLNIVELQEQIAPKDDILSQIISVVKSFGASINFIGDSITANFGISAAVGYTQLFADKIFSLNNVSDYMVDAVFSGDGVGTSSSYISGSFTLGTKGTNKNSIILGVNTVWSIFGGSEIKYLDFFFYRNPSAGKLELRRNGVLYRTIDCAGAIELDSCSYPSTAIVATGAATYTITCIDATVEVTGILRLTSAPTDKTVKVNRFAKSGTATADYTDQATLNSLLKIGGYASNIRNIYVIGLGTNDIYSTSASIFAAAYKTNLKLIADWLVDNNNIVILTVPPIPESSWPVKKEAFNNYRDKCYEVADELGLYVIDYSIHNFTGLYSDGLHPNASGHALMYEIIINALTFPSKLNVLPSTQVYSKLDINLKYGFIRNYWPLSEVVGSTAYDKAAAKNGVITGTSRVAGTFSNAKKFDGVDDNILVAGFSVPTNNFTFLFNMVTKPTVTSSFICVSYVFGSGTFGFGVVVHSGNLKMYVDNTLVYTLSAMTAIANGDKLAISIAGGFATLYINGVAGTPIAIGTVVSKANFYIGAGSTGGNLTWFTDAALDEIAFCRLLTTAEILALSTSTTPLM